jgi:hypothetical protein
VYVTLRLPSGLNENLAQERKHLAVELLWPLERGEMAHAGQDPQLRAGNALRKILGVFALDELIALAVYNRDRLTRSLG